jgi:hypothetical protein
MTRTKRYPVLVRRLFKDGESWAIPRESERYLLDVVRAVEHLTFKAEAYEIDELCGDSRVIGSISPDLHCPDPAGRARKPAIAVLAYVDRHLDAVDRRLVMEALQQIPWPEKPGVDDSLYVLIPSRWTIVRPPAEPISPKGCFADVAEFLGFGRTESLSEWHNEAIVNQCRSTESDLFRAARAGIRQFQACCHPQAICVLSGDPIPVYDPMLTRETVRKFVVDVDSTTCTAQIHMTGGLLAIIVRGITDDDRKTLVHQFEWHAATERLRLLFACRSG